MNDEIVIIEKQLTQMAEVFNALPEEVFRIKDMDTLLIMQRRIKESDLLENLSLYNEIFSKNEKVEIKDISKSVVAYIGIKTLVENQMTDFDARMRRQLIKEYKSQIIRVNNIIHLSKVNEITAESFQKESIQKTLIKNESLLEAFQNEVELLEKQIERFPQPEESQEYTEEMVQEKAPEKSVKTSMVHEVIFKVREIFSARESQKETLQKLRMEEKNNAKTKCVEIPFYDKSLAVTESFICKDIPAYSLFKKKNNIYFGLSKNLVKGVYQNSDQSLLELTEATEDFIQFMKEDILSGEFKMKPFSEREKQSLQMYFDFVTKCFENNIGNTVSVQEYIEFKNYYNQAVLTMYKLDEKFQKDLYRAMELTDHYLTYMDCYGLFYGDEKNIIVQNIMNEQSQKYIDDLELVMQHHAVNKKARNALQDLIQKIKFFAGKEDTKDEMKAEKNEDFYLPAKDCNELNALIAEEHGNIQVKIQFQNKENIIIDEALFAVSNLKKAVSDYLKRKAYIKKIGISVSGKDVFLYASKNESLSVTVLSIEMKKIKYAELGIQEQLIDFYEDQIKNIMIKLTQ